MSNYSKFCKRCGRPLKNEESRRTGFGNVCHQKMSNNKLVRNVFIKES